MTSMMTYVSNSMMTYVSNSNVSYSKNWSVSVQSLGIRYSPDSDMMTNEASRGNSEDESKGELKKSQKNLKFSTNYTKHYYSQNYFKSFILGNLQVAWTFWLFLDTFGQIFKILDYYFLLNVYLASSQVQLMICDEKGAPIYITILLDHWSSFFCVKSGQKHKKINLMLYNFI